MSWANVANILFGRNTFSGVSEQIDKTNDARNAAHVEIGDTGTVELGPTSLAAFDVSMLALESGGNLAAAAASLTILDDWDEGDRAKVNPIAGQAGVQGGSGPVTALTQRVVQAKVASATLTNVAASVTSGTLAASNAAREGLHIFNDANTVMYLKYGATASATSFTVKVPVDGFWEMPFPIYTGVVDGIWETGPTGYARVTEL